MVWYISCRFFPAKGGETKGIVTTAWMPKAMPTSLLIDCDAASPNHKIAEDPTRIIAQYNDEATPIV